MHNFKYDKNDDQQQPQTPPMPQTPAHHHAVAQAVAAALGQHQDSESFGFEGPEKTLHMVFEPLAALDAPTRPLRSVPQERWQQMLDLTLCRILSVMSNEHCDSYVLSESSLFVFDNRIILKTCGTTRLLLGVDDCMHIASDCGMRLRSVFYMRKNFTFPFRQPFPHTSFNDEKAYLDERFGGHSQVVGPLSLDHWYFYVADLTRCSDKPADTVVFEVKMHEIDTAAAAIFFKKSDSPNEGKFVTQATGIADLLPGQRVDEHLFDPCGYSMNGLLGPWYSTIHVTPEEHCSYVSFETNLPLNSYDALLSSVLKIFRPATFTASVVAPAPLHHRCVSGAPRHYEAVGVATAPLGAGLEVTTFTFINSEADIARRERAALRLLRSQSTTPPVADLEPRSPTSPSSPLGITEAIEV